jgi:hypothetical protein
VPLRVVSRSAHVAGPVCAKDLLIEAIVSRMRKSQRLVLAASRGDPAAIGLPCPSRDRWRVIPASHPEKNAPEHYVMAGASSQSGGVELPASERIVLTDRWVGEFCAKLCPSRATGRSVSTPRHEISSTCLKRFFCIVPVTSSLMNSPILISRSPASNASCPIANWVRANLVVRSSPL